PPNLRRPESRKLIDVAVDLQVSSLASKVTHHKPQIAANLLLDVQIPGLHVGVLEIGVDQSRCNYRRGAIEFASQSADRRGIHANRKREGRIRRKASYKSCDGLIHL